MEKGFWGKEEQGFRYPGREQPQSSREREPAAAMAAKAESLVQNAG